MFDKDIVLSLQNFNKKLKSEKFNFYNLEIVRKKLMTKGEFKGASKLSPTESQILTNKRPITAVDGSRIEYGSSYPYSIAIMRTLAATTGYPELTDTQTLSPLTPEVEMLVEDLARKKRISNEEALKLYLKNALAELELKTALAAVRKYKPYMLILDGGFLLFDKFDNWNILCEECVQNDTILVGVIEEVATAEVAPLIGIESIDRPRIYDREILFGLFNKGEYLHLHSDYKIKKDYNTIFARLSTSPQAIACDFIGEQESSIEDTLNLLFTLSPANGQGIPSWLQLVDARVRLRKKDMNRVLYTCLDSDVIERYFKPNRERRIY
ncbi:MAG TPA: DNA double-strand break repair nuclease NurA [Syntrophomonadaceae bacterium]|nr:DNA double-strand break repair nuclease NurA [Syntrophomonadaceae bacterium]